MRAVLATLILCAAMLPAPLALIAVAAIAFARDGGQWANQPAALRDWYANAELTKPAQKRLHFKSSLRPFGRGADQVSRRRRGR